MQGGAQGARGYGHSSQFGMPKRLGWWRVVGRFFGLFIPWGLGRNGGQGSMEDDEENAYFFLILENHIEGEEQPLRGTTLGGNPRPHPLGRTQHQTIWNYSATTCSGYLLRHHVHVVLCVHH